MGMMDQASSATTLRDLGRFVIGVLAICQWLADLIHSGVLG